MTRRIATTALCLLLLWLYWHDWELAKEIQALQGTAQSVPRTEQANPPNTELVASVTALGQRITNAEQAIGQCQQNIGALIGVAHRHMQQTNEVKQ